MMKLVKRIALASVALAFVAGTLGGCKEETAGEKVDKAVEDAKKELPK